MRWQAGTELHPEGWVGLPWKVSPYEDVEQRDALGRGKEVSRAIAPHREVSGQRVLPLWPEELPFPKKASVGPAPALCLTTSSGQGPQEGA